MSRLSDSFNCPQCGQAFAWTARIAGRKLACGCGQVLVVPLELTEPTQTYELNDEDPPPGQLAIDDRGNERPAPPLATVAAPKRVLDYKRPRPDADPSDEPARGRFRDIWLPAGLIGACLLALAGLVTALHMTGNGPRPLLPNLLTRLGWDIMITLLCAVLLTWLIDAAFGIIHIAILKISAVAMTRFTIWAIFGMPVEHIGADLLGFVISFPVLLVLLSYLFELDISETLFAGVLITLLRWISYFGMWSLL